MSAETIDESQPRHPDVHAQGADALAGPGDEAVSREFDLEDDTETGRLGTTAARHSVDNAAHANTEGDDLTPVAAAAMELKHAVDAFQALALVSLSGDELVAALDLVETQSRRLPAVRDALVAEAKVRGVAEARGFRSTSTWLRDRYVITKGEAWTWLQGADRLAGRRTLTGEPLEPALPATAAARAAGALSAAQVKVIDDLDDELPRDLPIEARREIEAAMVAHAAQYDATKLASIGQHLLNVVDPDGAEPSAEEAHRRRGVTIGPLRRGLARISGHVDAWTREAILAVLASLSDPDRSPHRPDGREQPDAHTGQNSDAPSSPSTEAEGAVHCDERGAQKQDDGAASRSRYPEAAAQEVGAVSSACHGSEFELGADQNGQAANSDSCTDGRASEFGLSTDVDGWPGTFEAWTDGVDTEFDLSTDLDGWPGNSEDRTDGVETEFDLGTDVDSWLANSEGWTDGMWRDQFLENADDYGGATNQRWSDRPPEVHDADTPPASLGVDPEEQLVDLPVDPDRRLHPQRLHDALRDGCERLLASRSLPQRGGTPATILLTVPLETLEQRAGLVSTAHGGDVPVREVIRRAGDAAFIPIVIDREGNPLFLGRTRRLASPAQRYALHVRDGGCIIPGCMTPSQSCQTHHLLDWALGGKTDITNLALLCSYHHGQIADWTLVLKHGRIWVTPPAWVDRDQTPRINTYFRAAAPLQLQCVP